MAIQDDQKDPNAAASAAQEGSQESAGAPVLSGAAEAVVETTRESLLGDAGTDGQLQGSSTGEPQDTDAVEGGRSIHDDPARAGDSPVDEENPKSDVTFQNGAGETATIASLSNASVSQIPPPPTQPDSRAPGVTDAGVQDKTVAKPSEIPPPPMTTAAKTTEIPPPPTVAKAPVAAVAKTEVAEEPTEFAKFMAKIEATGTPAQKALVGNLSQYLNNMKKGRPMTPVTGAAQNHLLWLALFQVVEKAVAEEFRTQWNIVLAWFEEHKNDAFGPRHVFRFAEAWTRDPDHLAAMQRLINLIHLTSNRAEREDNLKRVDLGRTLAHPFSEEGRSRVMGFYNK